MSWFLLPIVGQGTSTDRYRPKYTDGLEWSSHGRLYFASIVQVVADDKVLANIAAQPDVVVLPDRLSADDQDKVSQMILNGAVKAGVAIPIDPKQIQTTQDLSKAVLDFQAVQPRADRQKIVDSLKNGT